MDKLTPQLSEDQLKANIDSMKNQGKDTSFIQGYVNNYSRGENGSFVLKQNKTNTDSGSKLESSLQAGDTGYLGGLSSRVGEQQVEGANKIAKSVTEGSNLIQQGMNTVNQNPVTPRPGVSILNPNSSTPEQKSEMQKSFLNNAKGGAKVLEGEGTAGFGTITGAAQSALAPVTAAVSPILKTSVPLAIKFLRYTHPGVAKLYDSLEPKVQESIAPQINAFAEKHPDVTTLAGDVANTVLLAAGGTEVEGPIKEALTKEGFQSAKDTLGEIPGQVKNLAQQAREGLANMTSKSVPQEGQSARGLFDSLKNKITNKIQGKSLEDILTTPQNKLSTLSDEERNIYFQDQKEQLQTAHNVKIQDINDRNSAMETQMKSDSEQKLSNIQIQNKDLENQVANANVKEAQSLKPKLIQSMRDNSNIYRQLVDKEIGQHATIPVKIDDLRQFIESRYVENPAQGQAIIEKLGLKEPIATVGKDGLGTVQTEASALPDKTIGEIYDNTKSLRQELGAGAKSGTKTFTPSDKLTDDAINTLSSYLKSQGVDLSEANKFWSEYAPLRNKLVTKIQPFTVAGAETAQFNTFAKGIQKAVQGTDPYNANFISETERLLGTKIGNPETRTAIEKLTQGQKEEILAKAEAEARIAEQKESVANEKNQAKQNLTSQEKELENQKYEIQRQARFKKYLSRALIGGLGLLVTDVVAKELAKVL